MTRYYVFTGKAKECGYGVEYFQREADEILRHHYNDDFELYVSSYSVDENGFIWHGSGVARVIGISVSSNDDATIDWFVRTWVKLGYLKETLPVTY